MEFEKLGAYRLGSNIPVGKGAVWENVARVARWGAPVIELNTNAERLGTQALDAIKELAKANDLTYTWHVPPSAEESGELAIPNDPRRNEFARKIMERAIKSAAHAGAKHITFHATLQAGRLPQDQLYVYDERQKQVGAQRVIEGLSREETLKLLDDTAKAQLRTQLNSTESQLSTVKGLRKTTELITKKGVDDRNALAMVGLVGTLTQHSSMLGLRPQEYHVWQGIQDKVLHQQSLTDREKQVIKDYSKKVGDQLSDYENYFKAQKAQLAPFKDHDHLVRDGEQVMMENVAKNIALLDKGALKTAVKEGISLGFENLPGNQVFSTPEELNKLRELTVNELVKQKKLSKAEAEKFIGFTFDFGHANTAKYVDIAGKSFASPSEFIEQLKGPIKHVHATDSIGIVDGHLPLGQGEITREEMKKIKAALEKSGFKGTAIHELGASQLPVLYGSSVEWFEQGNYMVGGLPTGSMWGPSYLAAGMTDPLNLEKDKGYFYESFIDLY